MARTGYMLCLAGVLVLGTSSYAMAQSAPDFLNVSLDQLADIEVTSVSKKSEKASQAAAAIYVITQEDIRRSGFTSIPEALRMVPGLNVARSGSNQWAISSRGFNDQFSNKLLVLMDGRTVYSPIFSGVWWDAQDTLIEDIDRIEVIRGPGATLWGANAVNGVINIITKHAKDTRGGYASTGGGTEERGFVEARYGFEMDDYAYMRAYAKYFNRNEMSTADDRGDTNDKWYMSRYGFRLDWDMSDSDVLTVQGDLYNGRERGKYMLPVVGGTGSSTVFDDQETKGGNILTRWNHQFNRYSDVSLQSYFDYTNRDLAVIEISTYTYDLDFQHGWQMSDRNELVWGLGYRYLEDDIDNSFQVAYDPASKNRHLFSWFIQDKIALVKDELYLTVGSKFEHNDHTHFEYQPSARMAWLIDESQTLWGAVSRAVRSPSRVTDDLINPIYSDGSTVVTRYGNTNSESEDLMAYELGYRIQPEDNLALDVTAFYNDYSNIIASEQGTPRIATSGGLSYLEVPLTFFNNGEAEAYGVELAANWNPVPRWNLAANYSYLNVNLKNTDQSQLLSEGKSPKHQVTLRSVVDLPWSMEFDQSLYYVDSLRPDSSLEIGDYLRLDLRLGWEPIDGLEFSVVGQNLLDPQHPEFSSFLYNPVSQIGRSVYGKVTWRF